jgi:hypothetical protein
MFGWLRKNKSRPLSAEQLSQEMTRIVNTYVALLKAHPHHVMDASWLPADKQKMVEIFKISWLAANARDNDEMRKAAESWWCLLSHFQPGVGAVPLDVKISKDNPTVKEWRERKERVEKWLEIATTEAEKYEIEIKNFRCQQRI